MSKLQNQPTNDKVAAKPTQTPEIVGIKATKKLKDSVALITTTRESINELKAEQKAHIVDALKLVIAYVKEYKAKDKIYAAIPKKRLVQLAKDELDSKERVIAVAFAYYESNLNLSYDLSLSAISYLIKEAKNAENAIITTAKIKAAKGGLKALEALVKKSRDKARADKLAALIKAAK